MTVALVTRRRHLEQPTGQMACGARLVGLEPDMAMARVRGAEVREPPDDGGRGAPVTTTPEGTP